METFVEEYKIIGPGIDLSLTEGELRRLISAAMTTFYDAQYGGGRPSRSMTSIEVSVKNKIELNRKSGCLF